MDPGGQEQLSLAVDHPIEYGGLNGPSTEGEKGSSAIRIQESSGSSNPSKVNQPIILNDEEANRPNGIAQDTIDHTRDHIEIDRENDPKGDFDSH